MTDTMHYQDINAKQGPLTEDEKTFVLQTYWSIMTDKLEFADFEVQEILTEAQADIDRYDDLPHKIAHAFLTAWPEVFPTDDETLNL